MTTVGSTLNDLTRFVIERYDGGRFRQFLELPVAEGEKGSATLAHALLEAGAGPALLFLVGSAEQDDNLQSTLFAGLQGQFEAIGALIDWKRSSLDTLQVCVAAHLRETGGETAFANRAERGADLAEQAVGALRDLGMPKEATLTIVDRVYAKQKKGSAEAGLADVVIAALAAAEAEGVVLRDALTGRIEEILAETTDDGERSEETSAQPELAALAS